MVKTTKQNIYLLKVINKNTRAICSFASIVKFEHILHLSLMFLLLTFNRYFSADCINIYRIVLAPSMSSFDFIFNLAFLTWYLPGICQWNVKIGKNYIFMYRPLRSLKRLEIIQLLPKYAVLRFVCKFHPNIWRSISLMMMNYGLSSPQSTQLLPDLQIYTTWKLHKNVIFPNIFRGTEMLHLMGVLYII